MSEWLLYIAGVLTGGWGVAHLFPTKNVVRGFGDISEDNRRVITMEWVTEGVALIFIGVLVIVTTIIDYASPVAVGVYSTSAVALVLLAVVSTLTGFKIKFLPYRLCPFLFGTSAVLIILGIVLN